MSADTHTTAPRHGATDERYAAGLRQARVAVAGEHRSGLQPVVEPDEVMLTWDQDSRTVPVVGGRQPRLRQIMGVCGWAAVLGAIGLVVAIRGFIADLMDQTPSWYEPMMIAVGLAGIGLTVGAFISVHRRRTPYLLLGAATIVLGYAIFLTAQAI